MSSLAEPLEYDPPASFGSRTKAPNELYAKLLWNGLDARTRANYNVAVTSYEYFCAINELDAWPATLENLGRWITVRACGSSAQCLRQVKPDTIQGYLLALRSHHVDLRLPTTVFESDHLKRMIRGARRLFPSRSVDQRRPITKSILRQITNPSLELPGSDGVNITVAFKVAFAGFLRLGEFTYSTADLSRPRAFSAAKVKRNDIKFFADSTYATLTLPRSKTDIRHKGVRIILAATGEPTCPVRALQRLCEVDPRPSTAPLFRLSSGTFSRSEVLAELDRRLALSGISPEGYKGQSFRKGAAQSASDNGLTQDEIQTLGRWTSDAVQRYFTTARRRVLSLSRQFQTGRVS